MNITLYYNKSDPKDVYKNLDEIVKITGELKQETDILNPTLILSNVDSYIGRVNYIYIEELNRYYYVEGISSIKNNLWSLDCKVDVLMTYREQIYEQSGNVLRQEYVYNPYLKDNRIKVKSNPTIQTLKFPFGFNGGYSYVMLVSANDVDFPWAQRTENTN